MFGKDTIGKAISRGAEWFDFWESYSPCLGRIPSERPSQEEQNGAIFGSPIVHVWEGYHRKGHLKRSRMVRFLGVL